MLYTLARAVLSVTVTPNSMSLRSDRIAGWKFLKGKYK